MSAYTTSQKLCIINNIDQESRELWRILNDHAGSYNQDDVKALFVSILSQSSAGGERFNLEVCRKYIENACNPEQLEHYTAKNFDILHLCYMATIKENLHSFLFDTAK